jgi:hypothetical protein
MTLRRAALYVGGASLLIAWFSSAASVPLEQASSLPATDGGRPEPAPADLASEVHQQARRLRQRLASAPLPQQPSRNPFTFRSAPRRERPQPTTVVMAPPPALAPEVPSEPALLLIGIAEQKRPEGVVRIAMMATAADELIMAAVGETVMQRYKLTALGHDTAELSDLVTGQVRRISLQ